MRLFSFVLGMLALLAMPAFAVDFSNPKAVVEAAYAPYLAGESFDWSSYDPTVLQSAGLNALFAKDAEESGGEVGRVDFDPLVNGQDYDIKKLQIGEPVISGGVATVEVKFENFEEPETLHIVLVQEAGGYKIDDIQSLQPEYPYKLRELLTAPLPTN